MFLWRSKDPVMEGVMTIQGISDGNIPHFPAFFGLQDMQAYLK